MPKGAGPTPHVHADNDEWFYLLHGDIDMHVGGQEFQATAGYSLLIPRETVHSFQVASETSRVLNGFTPAAMDEIIRTLARPAESRELPPKGLDTDPAKLQMFANNSTGHTV